jgi:hypothetical protein
MGYRNDTPSQINYLMGYRNDTPSIYQFAKNSSAVFASKAELGGAAALSSFTSGDGVSL